MSAETLTVQETNHQMQEFDDVQDAPKVAQETIKEGDWDFELTSFVGANAHQLIDCPWLPGTDMTLHDITINWPVRLTPENVDFVVAELRQRLADKLLVDEDIQEVFEEEQEVGLVDEPETSPISKQAEKDKQEPTATAPKLSKEVRNTAEPITQILFNAATTPETFVTQLPSETLIVSRKTYDSSASYSSASTEDLPPSPKPNDANNELPKVDTPIYPETKVADLEITHFDAVLDAPQIIEKILPVFEPQEIAQPDTISNVLDSSTNNGNELIPETVTIQPPKIFTAETAQTEELALIEEEIIEPGVVNQVEEILETITESVEQSEIDTTQKIHEIIVKIIDIPVTLQNENTIDENQAQEEIAILFTELLEALDIAYTPEILESLTQLTLSSHFALAIEGLKDISETDESKQSSAISKVVQQLTATLAHITVAMDQACAIGKSALMHFGLSIANPEL